MKTHDALLQIEADARAWKWSIEWSWKNAIHPMANSYSRLITALSIQDTNRAFFKVDHESRRRNECLLK